MSVLGAEYAGCKLHFGSGLVFGYRMDRAFAEPAAETGSRDALGVGHGGQSRSLAINPLPFACRSAVITGAAGGIGESAPGCWPPVGRLW